MKYVDVKYHKICKAYLTRDVLITYVNYESNRRCFGEGFILKQVRPQENFAWAY